MKKGHCLKKYKTEAQLLQRSQIKINALFQKFTEYKTKALSYQTLEKYAAIAALDVSFR